MTLLDITDTENIIYYSIYGRFADIHSFGDYDGDGQLDFPYISYLPLDEYKKDMNETEPYYQMKFYTIKDNNITKSKMKPIYIRKDKNYRFHLWEKLIFVNGTEAVYLPLHRQFVHKTPTRAF